LQAIFPKIRTFVDEFHAGKPAGHNENSAANKPVVTDHSAAQKAATKPAAAPQPKSNNGKSTTKRGSQRIEMKETFYACAHT
jgi:hypothetical protein